MFGNGQVYCNYESELTVMKNAQKQVKGGMSTLD